MASRLSGKRVLLAMLVILLLAVIPGVFLPTLACREDRKLETLDTIPAFSFTDERGEVFTEDALRGHPTIINFIFTRCDTVCPITAMKMQRLEKKSRDKRAVAVKFLSISVDPAHDQAPQLAAFAAKYKANPERWRFISGSLAATKALVEGPFMSPMDREGTTTSGAPNIVHSGYFFLVDGDLKIRGIYDSNDIKRLDEMLHDARYLARTHRHGYKFGGG
jgi:protein SCO1/2